MTKQHLQRPHQEAARKGLMSVGIALSSYVVVRLKFVELDQAAYNWKVSLGVVIASLSPKRHTALASPFPSSTSLSSFCPYYARSTPDFLFYLFHEPLILPSGKISTYDESHHYQSRWNIKIGGLFFSLFSFHIISPSSGPLFIPRALLLLPAFFALTTQNRMTPIGSFVGFTIQC